MIDRLTRSARLATAAGLLVAAAGLVTLGGAGARDAVPPGIVILPFAALFVALAPWGWAPGVGVLVALFVGTRFVAGGRAAYLLGQGGTAQAAGHWMLAVGAAVALVAGVRGLRRGDAAGLAPMHATPVAQTPASVAAGGWGRWAQVAGLLVLAPVCAEYLAAYDDSTGDPMRLLSGLLIFAPLYGAPALLIREVARRKGLGWTGMMLMAAAFAVVQAGVVDQSLFTLSYRDIDGWEASRRSTLIAPLGIGAQMTQSFVAGHVAYSMCAPIALVEASRPAQRLRPWLGTAGLGFTTILYVAASVLVLVDHLRTQSSHASTAQVVASFIVVGGLIAAAFLQGRRERPLLDRPAPRPATLFAVSLLAATAHTFAPDSWGGFAFAMCVLAAAAAGLARASRSSGWDVRHHVAVAAGVVLSRAALAFTYFPVVGQVGAVPKYLHNAVLLAALVLVSFHAARAAAAAARAAKEEGSGSNP